MSLEEIHAFIRGVERKERGGWEQARMIGYYSLLASGNKIKKPDDLFKFPWEKKEAKPRKLNKRELNKRIKEGEKWLETRK